VSRIGAAVIAALLVSVPAFPCGGPGADVVDLPLIPVSGYLARTLYDDDYQVRFRPELRFLEPYHRAGTDSIARLYAFAYEGGGSAGEDVADTLPGHFERELLAPVYRDVERGEYEAAVTAARRVVTDVLDMPAGVAFAYRDALRGAVEAIDVVPGLTSSDRSVAARFLAADSAGREGLAALGTLPEPLRVALAVRRVARRDAGDYAAGHPGSPRLASLRFVALQEAMRAGIPDGWASSIRDSVPPDRWIRLEALHDDWLRRFPTHPLADFVRLSKVRLFYFAGEDARAWDELLAMYPRHRERVLGEMRYLVQQSALPDSVDDPRLPWELRAALLPDMSVSPATWSAFWRATESHADAPWALPMQERLLWKSIGLAASSRTLPAGFPARARAPSALWAKLRLLALLQAGDVPAALTQADSTPEAEADVDAIRRRLHLLRGDWGRALDASPVGDPATAYLIRVLAPAPVVDSLAAARGSPLATDARLTIAARLSARGDWARARPYAATDAAKARLWATTTVLATDTSRAGRLAFARWMRDHRGELFFGESTFWVRGLNWRRDALRTDTSGQTVLPPKLDPRLPWTADEERARIATHLRSTTELYYALHAYAQWLDRAGAGTPGLATVVREADQVYNRLVSWDETNSRFWTETLTSSPEARSIRRAGALLRRR
jgi:hypothetical protein